MDNQVFVESKCLKLLRLITKALRSCFQQFQNLVCILGNISNHQNLSESSSFEG